MKDLSDQWQEIMDHARHPWTAPFVPVSIPIPANILIWIDDRLASAEKSLAEEKARHALGVLTPEPVVADDEAAPF